MILISQPRRLLGLALNGWDTQSLVSKGGLSDWLGLYGRRWSLSQYYKV